MGVKNNTSIDFYLIRGNSLLLIEGASVYVKRV